MRLFAELSLDWRLKEMEEVSSRSFRQLTTLNHRETISFSHLCLSFSFTFLSYFCRQISKNAVHHLWHVVRPSDERRAERRVCRGSVFEQLSLGAKMSEEEEERERYPVWLTRCVFLAAYAVMVFGVWSSGGTSSRLLPLLYLPFRIPFFHILLLLLLLSNFLSQEDVVLRTSCVSMR